MRRGQANLLGGRALRYELHGLTAAELGDAFDLDRVRTDDGIDILPVATFLAMFGELVRWRRGAAQADQLPALPASAGRDGATGPVARAHGTDAGAGLVKPVRDELVRDRPEMVPPHSPSRRFVAPPTALRALLRPA